MGRKRKDSVRADERSFSDLRNKIDQALKQKEPHAAKRKSEDDSAAKQGPRKKQQRHKPAPNPPRTEKPKENGAQNHTEVKPASENALLDEIRALGGDENDLDLVMGVASDSEDEYGDSSAPLSKDMRSELAQFASQLGFSQIDRRDSPSDVEDAPDPDAGISDAESSGPGPAPSKKGATVRQPCLYSAYSFANCSDI